MSTLRIPFVTLLILLAAACVTINVYFPAQAAEQAADRIIRDVYGEGTPAPAEPQSLRDAVPAPGGFAPAVLDWFIAPAHAEADISVDSPAIRQLRGAMEGRHRQLAPHYGSGAVGIAHNGQLEIRDQKLVPLKDRNAVKQLVSKENRDRDALYREIARVNGHPEWETEIRETFARRWVDNARGGWWYRDAGGNWKQK